MKKLALAMCLILMITLFPCPVSAQGRGDYYDRLSSEAFQEAYEILEEGIAAMAPVIRFPTELEIRYMDMLEIARAVCLDHPEYFWFLESWFYEYDTQDGRYLVDTFTPTYYLDHEQVSAASQALADAMIAFRDRVDEIIAGIPANFDSDYEIALYLHDYLAEHVTYTLEGDHDSAYAALIHGKAACYGYSKAYQYLLSQAGVRAQIVVGDSVGEDGALYGHAWNLVWIDGDCYYTDVTWDDLEWKTIHQYFLMSLEEISQDHIADERFSLPDCGHELDFYERSSGKGAGKIYPDTSGTEAAKYFQMVSLDGHEAVFAGEILFATDTNSWLNDNAMELLRSLGLSSNSRISYYHFGDVYYLMLEDPYYKSVYPRAQSVTLNLTEVTLMGPGEQILLVPEVTPFGAGVRMPVYTSDCEEVAVVSNSGMVTAVGPGTATITVSSFDGMASAQCIVTVEHGTLHQHSLRLIPAYDPTCTLDGNASYYLCTGCFRRFEDEEAAQLISDISPYVRMATGHIDVSWQPRENSTSHQQVCSCGYPIPQTIKPHADEDGNGLCDLCGAEVYVPSATESTENEPQDNSFPIGWIGFGLLAAVIVVYLFMNRRY